MTAIPRPHRFLAVFTRALSLAVLCFAILGLPVHAADTPATGTIEGRVLNAANGAFLSKASVSVQGTSLTALTDDDGQFKLRNVPVGKVTLVTSYSGRDTKREAVEVTAEAVVVKEISLSGPDDATVMNKFVVQANRFRDAQDIATNDERQSVSIKNVVAADAFGHVPDGNIGEFVQFLPGVDVGYGGTYVYGGDASSISVRGFGPEDTAVMVDGMPMASASAAGLTRAVGLDLMSINNASRIEILKVATPDMPNDSPGGSVNLVTRSAFEYAKPTFGFEVSANLNSNETTIFKRTPGPANKATYHTLPSGSVSMTMPFSEKLGISVSLGTDNKYGPGDRWQPTWKTTSSTIDMRPLGGADKTPLTNAKGTASYVNPWLERASISENPWNTYKQSGNFKVDWKPLRGLKVTANFQYSQYSGINVDRRVQMRVGAPADWGEDFTRGYQYQVTSKGTFNPGHAAEMTLTARDKMGDSMSTYLKANYSLGPWEFAGSASRSRSRSRFVDMENDHFSGFDLRSTVGRVDFEGINESRPARVLAWDRNGLPYDYSRLAGWLFDGTLNAQSGEAFSSDLLDNYQLDLRRELDFMPFPSSIKVGWARREKTTKKWGRGTGYKMRYTGPALTPGEILDEYELQPIYGMTQPQQFASPYKLYDIYKAHPEYFDPNYDVGLSIGNYNSLIAQTRSIKEVSDSVYAQLEASFFKGRLRFVTGARQKESSINGRQPIVDSKFNYVRLPDGRVYTDDIYRQGVKYDGGTGPLFAGGNYARDAVLTDTALRSRMIAAGANVPDALALAPDGLANGTASNNLLLAQERYKIKDISRSRKDPATPQVQTAIKITDRINLKLSWSRETKLQNLESGTTGGLLTGGNSSFVLNENLNPDGSPGSDGSITLGNPTLSPEITNSWNSEVSFFTDSGGKFSVSYFYKQTSNLWDDEDVYNTSPEYAAILQALGLDPNEFENWKLTTTVNSAAKASRYGIEADVRQNLGILGRWARGLNVFVTYSHRPNAASDEPEKPILGYLRKLPTRDKWTGGIAYGAKRFSIQARAVYTQGGLSRNSTFSYTPPGATAANTYQVYNLIEDDLKLNLQCDYQLSERYTLSFSAKDVLNARVDSARVKDIYTNIMPDYSTYRDSRYRGVLMTLSLSGRF